LVFALAAALAASCVSNRGPTSPGAPSAEDARMDAALEPPPPTWKYQPLSWAKLDEIERWLATPGANADPSTHCEAQLQLAQGLLDYANRERAKTGESVFDARVARAEHLLRDAMGDSALSPQQRGRATATLAKVLSSRGAPAEAQVASETPRPAA